MKFMVSLSSAINASRFPSFKFLGEENLRAWVEQISQLRPEDEVAQGDTALTAELGHPPDFWTCPFPVTQR